MAAQKAGDLATRAKALHHRLLTVDTHCDTPMRMEGSWKIGERHEPGQRGSGCQDLPRMKEGGLAASFFAVYLGQGPLTDEGRARAKAKADQIFDRLDRMFEAHPELCERALTAADARRIFQTGRRAIFLGVENGYPVGREVANVDGLYRRGARYITLSHNGDNDLCDSSTDTKDPVDRGLSDLGRQVVARMNALGMMVDVSHISERSFFDVLKATKAPVLASHSCARALCDHPRNLTDVQLRALKANGGVIQLCLVSDFIKALPKSSARAKAQRALAEKVQKLGGWDQIQDPKLLAALGQEWEDLDRNHPQDHATVKDAVDHIDHIVKTIGIDHVGIGTDFDGGGGLQDCHDVTQLHRITEELLRRGYGEQDIAKIWGGNALRVLEAAERAASRKP